MCVFVRARGAARTCRRMQAKEGTIRLAALKLLGAAASAGEEQFVAGTQFPCFTGTKVQTLTLLALLAFSARRSAATPHAAAAARHVQSR